MSIYGDDPDTGLPRPAPQLKPVTDEMITAEREREVARRYAAADNSPEALRKDALKLGAAAAILRERFPTGRHSDTESRLAGAAAELVSRARHPGRLTPPMVLKEPRPSTGKTIDPVIRPEGGPI